MNDRGKKIVAVIMIVIGVLVLAGGVAAVFILP